MTIKQFIESAIEGGCKYLGESIKDSDFDDVTLNYGFITTKKGTYSVKYEEILLDVKAWEAVGKVLNWPTYWMTEETWENKMHGMIDALIDGDSAEEYIKTL